MFFILIILSISNILPLTPALEDSIIRLAMNDIGIVVEDDYEFNQIPQYIFESVQFYIVDTSSVISVPRPIGNTPFRVAIDQNMKVYKLFGFPNLEFNKLVNENKVDITLSCVYNYGRFYLDICHLYDDVGYYYLSGVDEFIEINKRIIDQGIMFSHPKKNLTDEIKKIQEICDKFNFRQITYDKDSKIFNCDYYVWFTDTGELFYYRLSITANGLCEIAIESLIEKDMGFWLNIH